MSVKCAQSWNFDTVKKYDTVSFYQVTYIYYNNSDAPSQMFHVPLKSTFCLGQMLWFDTVKKYDNSLLRSSSHILFRYWETNVVPLLWNLRSLCMFSSNLLIIYDVNFYSVNKYDFFSCYRDANAYRLPQGWLWILTLSVKYMFSWKRRFCAGQMCVDYLYQVSIVYLVMIWYREKRRCCFLLSR